jgi:tRNA-dihydrouridine synthase
MAGVIDVSMRILLIQYGAGMVFSEMVSAEGIRRNQRGSTTLVTCLPEESPCGVQLFGRDPSARPPSLGIPRSAAWWTSTWMPVEKFGRGGGPSHEPGLAGRSWSRCGSDPVTAKIRAGWDTSAINYREVGERLADAGADAVILHPRTAVQFFSGAADWSLVTDLAGRLPIPVIGSGDIGEYRQAQERMSETGAAFVMIGRAAMGRPWVFSRATDPGRAISTIIERHRLIRTAPPVVRRFGPERHGNYYIRLAGGINKGP